MLNVGQNVNCRAFDEETIRDTALVYFRRLKVVYAKAVKQEQESESADKENTFDMA
jgi:hypothetical protein